jgi:NADPH2:quinone reductase
MLMKAIVVNEHGGAEVLQYQDAQMPMPGPTQVLIRVSAASVNFADIKERIGKFHSTKKPPYIPGIDVTGIIEAVGSRVTKFRPGQRVVAFCSSGSYAEYTVAEEVLTYPVADHVDTDTAAAFPVVSFTSYNLLVQCARLQPGETVLIHAAAGGIGTTSIQIAKWLGAGMVIGTVGSAAKAAIALEAGADHVINYNETDFVREVLRLTHQKGADVILDSLAGEVFGQSLGCLSMFGRIVNFGNAKESAGGEVNTRQLHESCRSVIGYSMGTVVKHAPERLQDTAAAVIPLIESGKLKIVIGKRFALQEARLAHQWIEERKSTGKVLLYP